MLKLGRRLDLSEKTLGAQGSGEIRVQDFYRDVALMAQVMREIDSRHSSDADLASDAIAVFESTGETGHYVTHEAANLGDVLPPRNKNLLPRRK